MVSHFISKYQNNKIQAGNVIEGFYNYFIRYDALNSILALIGFMVGFVVMYQTRSVSVMTAFLTGVGADVFINKAEAGVSK